MTKILVLGGSGMLGSMVVDLLSRNGTLDVTATVRDGALAALFGARLPGAAWRVFRFDGNPATATPGSSTRSASPSRSSATTNPRRSRGPSR